MIDHYDWAGGREAMLRFGPEEGPVVVVAAPLFEEANRTRALTIAILRRLALHGIGGRLPELPGQGDSEIATVDARLPAWREAFAAAAACAAPRPYVFAIRGGALVDGEAVAKARLHLSPVRGRTLIRDLLRARRAALLAGGMPLVADDPAQPGPPLLLAGNLADRELLIALMAADPSCADRVLTLFPDGAQAARAIAPDRPPNEHGDVPRYRMPWLSSEPLNDADLAGALAGDIAAWIAACEG